MIGIKKVKRMAIIAVAAVFFSTIGSITSLRRAVDIFLE